MKGAGQGVCICAGYIFQPLRQDPKQQVIVGLGDGFINPANDRGEGCIYIFFLGNRNRLGESEYQMSVKPLLPDSSLISSNKLSDILNIRIIISKL